MAKILVEISQVTLKLDHKSDITWQKVKKMFICWQIFFHLMRQKYFFYSV